MLERGRECGAERVAQILAVGAEVLAQQECQRAGVDRVDVCLVRQGIENARRDRVQFSQPEILQACNYNQPMIVVRYGTLAALVLLGGRHAGLTRFGDLSNVFPSLTLICGAIVVIGLLTMKFIGPPPPAFFPRIALALLMLAVPAPRPGWRRAHGAVGAGPQSGLGFVLLHWYARE